MAEREEVACFYCGGQTEFVDGTEIYPHRNDLGDRFFFRCIGDCDAYVGVHRGTEKPLGTTANKECRKARMACYRAFDPLWQDAWKLPCYQQNHDDPDEVKRARQAITRAARRRAYAYLADEMGIPLDDCHISHLNDIPQLRRFYAIAVKADAQTIRDWWKREGEKTFSRAKQKAKQEAKAA